MKYGMKTIKRTSLLPQFSANYFQDIVVQASQQILPLSPIDRTIQFISMLISITDVISYFSQFDFICIHPTEKTALIYN